MYRFLFTALVTGIVLQTLSSTSEVHAGNPKVNTLEGTWKLVSTEKDGKVKSELADPFTLVVSGTTVRLRHGKQLIWEATIKQHSADKAGRVKFDLTYDRTKGDAPPPEDHGSCYGVFQVRGDELKFATAHGSNDNERPKDFNTTGKAGDGRVFTWHRAEKAVAPSPPLGVKPR
jgi:uncharacterized protein (TIGR03067 family)